MERPAFEKSLSERKKTEEYSRKLLEMLQTDESPAVMEKLSKIAKAVEEKTNKAREELERVNERKLTRTSAHHKDFITSATLVCVLLHPDLSEQIRRCEKDPDLVLLGPYSDDPVERERAIEYEYHLTTLGYDYVTCCLTRPVFFTSSQSGPRDGSGGDGANS